MRVFGIDCGTEITGYGVVETCDTPRESRIICKAMGEIRLLKSESTSQRLHHVYRELTSHLEQTCPEVVAIEEVFYSVNVKSALKLGQVRGVALLAAARLGLPVAEYAPLRIKSSVAAPPPPMMALAPRPSRPRPRAIGIGSDSTNDAVRVRVPALIGTRTVKASSALM